MNTPVKKNQKQEDAHKLGTDQVEVSYEFKRSVLENFDLEVESKAQQFEELQWALLKSFLNRQEIELSSLPARLRQMTVLELGESWNGNIQKTLEKIVRGKLEAKAATDVSSPIKRSDPTPASASRVLFLPTLGIPPTTTPTYTSRFVPSHLQSNLTNTSSHFRYTPVDETNALSTNDSPLILGLISPRQKESNTLSTNDSGESIDMELENEEHLLEEARRRETFTYQNGGDFQLEKGSDRGLTRRISKMSLSNGTRQNFATNNNTVASANSSLQVAFNDDLVLSFDPDLDSPSKLEELDVSDSVKKAAKQAIFLKFMELQNKWAAAMSD